MTFHNLQVQLRFEDLQHEHICLDHPASQQLEMSTIVGAAKRGCKQQALRLSAMALGCVSRGGRVRASARCSCVRTAPGDLSRLCAHLAEQWIAPTEILLDDRLALSTLSFRRTDPLDTISLTDEHGSHETDSRARAAYATRSLVRLCAAMECGWGRYIWPSPSCANVSQCALGQLDLAMSIVVISHRAIVFLNDAFSTTACVRMNEGDMH
nr:hypothetical protein CFP56_21957 [Quercus suber]